MQGEFGDGEQVGKHISGYKRANILFLSDSSLLHLQLLEVEESDM